MGDLINRQNAIAVLLEKGQRSKRYKLGEIWELNFDEIREALATVPSAGNEAELDKLTDQLNNCNDRISELEAKCRDLEEELHKAHLAVEHNRHVADEEQLRGALRYRDGVIHGLKYAMRCNCVSGGEVDQ